MSSATISAGDLALAPAIMPRPIGPHPATTTTSAKVIWARSTACRAQDSGSAKAACAGGMSALIRCTSDPGVSTMYSSIPPGLARLKPYMLCTWHMW